MIFWIELLAALSGLVSIYLVTRQNIWCWPIGIASVALYTLVFYDARLYSDLILHIIYVVVQIYGWLHWNRGSLGDDDLRVTSLPITHVLFWVLVALAGTLGWGWGMSTYTDASLAYGDAFTTVGSLVAQWLTARKRIESWVFWFVIDVVAIAIYLTKGLYMTSALYALFLVLCIMGFRQWRHSMEISAPLVAPA